MSTYREIHGKGVKSLGTDPSATTDAGQIWYNTSSNTFKSIVNIAAWSSSSNTINALYRRASAGPTTAAFLAGGDSGPGPSVSNLTEEWDGSGFSVGGTLNTGRYSAGGAGTLTAGLAFGGGTNPTPPNYQTATESYNGTAWTNSPNGLNTARFVTQGVGTTTAALCMGGLKSPSNTASNDSEEWGGTSWTAGNTLNTARESAAQAGIQTAALLAGGYSTTYSAATESYDGTTWTNVNSMNTARFSLGGAGTQTAAVAYGGDKNPSALTGATESWDGTNWATSPASLATARTHVGDFGSSTNAFAAGGYTPSATTVTEEYNFTVNVITGGAWASMPTLSYSVNSDTSASGSTTSAVNSGGYNAPAGPGTVSYIANAASWNGTAWTNITDMPERRTNSNAVGATAPAYYVYGGANQPPSPGTVASYLTSTYTWNGSAWGSGPALAEGQSDGGGAGTPSAIVLMGGVAPPGTISNNIQEYNGSSWSNNPVNMPTNMSGCGAAGTQTAAVLMGGYQGGSPFPSAGVTNSYEWDGSSVAAGGALVFGLLGTAGSGTQTAALLYGGRNTGGNKESICMTYNGTAWATSPSLGTGRDYIGRGPTGSQTSALAVSGSCPSQSLVEEYTGAETTAVNVKTLTQS